MTEELGYLKKQLSEKDILFDNLTNMIENLQTDILSIQNSPPSTSDPFGENIDFDKKFVHFDEIKPILEELKSIRKQIDDSEGSKTANYLTTKDLRGLVLEISKISQELPKFVTEVRVKEFFQEYEIRKKNDSEIIEGRV